MSVKTISPKRSPVRRPLELFRPQCDLVGWALGLVPRRDIQIIYPTGGGKTTMGLLIMALSVGRDRPFRRGIIAAPQNVILDGYHPRWPLEIEGTINGQARRWTIDPAQVRRAGVGGRTVAAALAYLADPDPGYILTCTQQTLFRVLDQFEGSLAGTVLLYDESHHAGAKGQSRAIKTWRSRGGRLFFATATPFRADGRAAILPDMVVYERTMPEQMEGGRYAPARIDQHYIPIGRAGDVVTRSEFTGDTLSESADTLDRMLHAFLEKWIELGRPKTILTLPILRGGSRLFVDRVLALFEEAGARVLDVTGTRSGDLKRTIAALRAERGRRSVDSEYDLVVGIQRTREGMDWPHCSAAFMVGIGALASDLQKFGRATRLKPADYSPPEHRDVATVCHFVPCAGGHLDPAADFAVDALLLALHLADWNTAHSLTLTRMVRAALPPAEPGADPEPPLIITPDLPPRLHAQIQAVIAATFEGSPGGVTTDDLIRAVHSHFPDVDPNKLNKVLAPILANDSRLAADVAAFLSARLGRMKRPRARLRRRLARDFAALIERFRHEALGSVEMMSKLTEQVFTLTGMGIREWVTTVRNRRPLTDAEIIAAIREHRKRTGNWPTVTTIDPVAGTTRTWRAIDDQLRKRTGQGLGPFREQHFPESVLRAKRLTDAEIIAAIREHHQRTGNWPTQKTTGPVAGTTCTWAAIDQQLRKRTGQGLGPFHERYFPESKTARSRTRRNLTLGNQPDNLV